MLVAVPLALFVYLSVQSRYFGRWLLPAYPALAMLAALALRRASELIAARMQTRRAHGRRFRARTASAVLAGLTALVLVQPLAADIRSAQVLGRDDTRQQARDWIEAHYPPELRRVGRAGRARALVPLEPRGRPAELAQPLRAARRLDRAGLVVRGRSAAGASAPSTSPASWRVRTAACARPPTTPCSDPG